MDINNIAQKLMEADKPYYNTGRSSLSDQEYDSLREYLRLNCPDHPYFEKVGDTPSSAWKKTSHAIPMGSLRKSHTEEDFLNWAEKFKNEQLVMQLKLDGLSLSLDYEDSKFIQGITRGDGLIGENISNNVSLMRGFKQTLDIEGYSGSIRAEIVLERASFDMINSILPEDEQYSNPRNAAAGISRGLDGQFCRQLRLICYDLAEDLDEDKKIEKIKMMGLDVPQQIIGNYKEMVGAFKTFKDLRESLPFGIDGAVIKVISHGVQEAAGTVQNRPKGQIAWKFDPPGAATILENVTFETGRTGVITPLGHVDPVEIDGSVITKVTLHNFSEIKRLNLGIGDIIMLVKAGDVIPYVESVIEHKNNDIIPPQNCPVCGGHLTFEGIKLFCTNETCPAKELQRILHFIKTVKIDDLGEALIEVFYSNGKIRSISDIFKLKEDDIASIEGWGAKSAKTIIKNIDSKRSLAPQIFLASLGIPSFSTSTAEDMWKKYGDLSRIRAATVEDICSMKGYSDISAGKIVSGLKAFDSQITELLEHINFLVESNEIGKLSGQAFCFTGEMINTRSFYQKLVTKYGGKNDSSVTKTTTYLVCNENKGSSKSKKAEQYGCKIINEDQFMELIGETIEKKPKLVTKSLFDEE